MFEHIKNEDGYYFYSFKEKLSNNQTLEMEFWEEDKKYIVVSASVYSKRKYVNSEYKTYGKVGIESLLLAKLAIKLFIEFLVEQKLSKKIIIFWSDNRRRNVYYRGLKELGFKFEYLSGNNYCFKCLTKDVEIVQ
jgi:hypothetical protein